MKRMSSKNAAIACFLAMIGLAQHPAMADWRYGIPILVSVGYGPNRISFQIEGVQVSNCTCNETWTTQMCLNAASDQHEFEKAILLSAEVARKTIGVDINEATCLVERIQTRVE